MAFPFVPVALAGAAAIGGYLLFFRKPAASGSPSSGGGGLLSPKPAAPGSPGAPSSQDMPADIRAAYQELLARGQDPDAMLIAANKMEMAGYPAEAAQLRARAAQLAAQRKQPAAPVPTPVSPVAPVAPVVPALPILPYQPDLTPLPVGTGNSSYYYDPSNGKRAKIDVRADARALRFLGYSAPADPGGGGGLAADRGASVGSFHPAMRDAVKHFQSDSGVTADEWLGPQTLTKLGQAVTVKNQQNSAANSARGVADATFAGVNSALFGKAITPPVEGAARVCATGGLRMRSQPQRSASGTNWIPAGALVSVLQVLPGEKTDAAAPGLGGWVLVRYNAIKGWVPSEWLGR